MLDRIVGLHAERTRHEGLEWNVDDVLVRRREERKERWVENGGCGSLEVEEDDWRAMK